jgi:hypothetical protein
MKTLEAEADAIAAEQSSTTTIIHCKNIFLFIVLNFIVNDKLDEPTYDYFFFSPVGIIRAFFPYYTEMAAETRRFSRCAPKA